MKRNIMVLPVFLLILVSCSNTREITIQDIMFDEMGNEVIAEQSVEAVRIPDKVPAAASPARYRLQTRSDRYDANHINPQVYAIAATRATNKMLDETAEFYENPDGDVFLYIADIKKADRKMPDGIYSAARTTRDIIEGSKTFKVVNDMKEADYYLETVIDNAGTPEEPILVYKLILFDGKKNKINEWTETMRRVRNDDRSWW